MYQPAVYQFRLTVIIDGSICEQYTRWMTQAEAWVWAREKGAEMREMYADYRVKVEQS